MMFPADFAAASCTTDSDMGILPGLASRHDTDARLVELRRLSPDAMDSSTLQVF
jgi:hypothetical protein